MTSTGRYDDVTDEDIELLLRLIRNKVTQRPVAELLKENELPYSGSWDDLLERLRNGILSGQFSYRGLAEFLDRVESYGHQHVFLFNIKSESIDRLTNPRHYQAALREISPRLDINEFDAVDLPSQPEVAGVRVEDRVISVKWVEKREYLKLVEKIEDDPEYDLIRKYSREVQRRVNVLKVDTRNLSAELRIQSLPNSENYDIERAQYTRRAAPLIDLLRDVTHLNLSRAIIEALEEDDSVRVNRVKLMAADWTKAGYAAANQSENVLDTAMFRSLNPDFRRLCRGESARIYWKTDSGLEREVSTIVYEDRVAFTTAATMDEVEHVLQRIRVLAQRIS